MKSDGTQQTRLTNNSADDRYPAYAPDGKRMTFTSDRNSNWEVYTMRANGTEQTNLTDNPAFDFHSDWQSYFRIILP